MSKYLKNGMHLIYLDQCFLSQFLGKPEDQQWLNLRNLVLDGNSARKILCPTSLDHLIETSTLPDADAIFLDELMGKLSFGWALLDEFSQIARQIIAKLRNRPITRAQFLEKNLLRPITYPGALQKLREVKTGLDQNNAWTVQGVNELNALTR